MDELLSRRRTLGRHFPFDPRVRGTSARFRNSRSTGPASRSDKPSIASDVIVAPHHGADNGSAQCFIDAVDPEWVVFSAGHAHRHPRVDAAQRYLDAGIALSKIFRTDRADDESGTGEWKEGAVDDCSDPRGDDDVEILVTDTGTVTVGYAQGDGGCS